MGNILTRLLLNKGLLGCILILLLVFGCESPTENTKWVCYTADSVFSDDIVLENFVGVEFDTYSECAEHCPVGEAITSVESPDGWGEYIECIEE